MKRKYKSSKQRAEDILKLIRERQEPDIWHGFPELIPARPRPCLADDWQTFKKNFVEKYGNEKVQDTGMTHSEFLEYFKTGKREGAKGSRTLAQLLRELNEEE